MNLPKSVAVGPLSFEVHEVERMTDPDNPRFELWGRCECVEQAIYIRSDISPDRKRVTFLHECLHAISDAAGEPLNERTVMWMASALVDFFQRNPDVVRMFEPENDPDQSIPDSGNVLTIDQEEFLRR